MSNEYVASKILEPVEHSQPASPVVHVQTPNGSIRVFGDYKALNEVIEGDHYKMPNVEDILAT